MRILLPFDGSAPARRALEKIMLQAQSARDTEVFLLNVQPNLPLREFLLEGRPSAIRRLQVPMREAGRKLLAAAEKRLAAEGFECRPFVEIGDPAQVIVKIARRYHCEQIIMGTRGRGGVPKLLLGSVAAKVLHLSPIAVTLVK